MKLSYLTNLILLAVVLALLWLVYKPDNNQHAQATLSSIAADKVNEITIQWGKDPAMQLQKTASGWQIIKPFHARANDTRINMVLDVLKAKIHSEYITKDAGMLSQFGFDKTSPTLTVDKQQFIFGGTESISGRRYVWHEGKISLIDEQVYPLLNTSADGFIDSRLFDQSEKIQQIKLPYIDKNKLQQDHWLTVSKKDGHWTSDASPELATDKISSLIQSWKGAYAMQVSYLSDKALEKVSGIPVEIQLQAGQQTLALLVKLTEDGLLITNKAARLQYQFPTSLANQMFINLHPPKTK